MKAKGLNEGLSIALQYLPRGNFIFFHNNVASNRMGPVICMGNSWGRRDKSFESPANESILKTKLTGSVQLHWSREDLHELYVSVQQYITKQHIDVAPCEYNTIYTRSKYCASTAN